MGRKIRYDAGCWFLGFQEYQVRGLNVAKRRITIEDLFRLRVIGDIAMSPDGARVAFSMKRQDFKANKTYSNLYVVPVRGGRVRPLTHGKHMDTQPKWSPDGECIGFMSNRDKASCVWLLPMTGGEAVRLTDRDGDASDFAFSPDGKYVAYAYRPKNEREKLERDGKKDEIARGPQYKHIKRLWHKLDGEGFWNGNYKHIYRVRASGGGSEQLTNGDYDDDKPRYSPKGKHLAFLSNRTPNPDLELMNQDIYVMPASGGRIRKVTPKLGSIEGYSWAPDSKRFAYLGYLGKSRDHVHHVTGVWTVELTGRGTRCLTKSIDNNCVNWTIADVSEITFDGEPPIWSADGSRIYFVVSEYGACRLYEAPLGRGSPRIRVGGDLVVNSIRRTAPSGPMALVICDALNPGDIHVWDPDEDDAEPRRITQVNRGVLGGLLLSRPEAFACHRGRHTVHGWVLKPPGFKKGRKYPMVLEIHGGPQAQYGHLFFHEMQINHLAHRGMIQNGGKFFIGLGFPFMEITLFDSDNAVTSLEQVCPDQDLVGFK